MFKTRRKKRRYLYYFIFIFVVVILFYSFSKFGFFEKEEPIIHVSNTIFTNPNEDLNIKITDAISGISDISIILKLDSNDSGVTISKQSIKKEKELNVRLKLSEILPKNSGKYYVLRVEAKDSSYWNFLKGNIATKDIVIVLDSKKPLVNVIAHSPYIEKGGAAAVVFRARDDNLAEVYIEDNEGRKFIAKKYLKDSFYAALIAWDPRKKDFSANVVAKDKAKNITKERIKFTVQDRKYRISNIALKDSFLDGKIKSLTQQYSPEGSDFNKLESFKFINETLRNSNEKLIHELSSKIPENELKNFKLSPFLPLKNSAKVADFADHRFYSYENEAVSNSHHLGLDLASVAQAPIISSNEGSVVFAGENGIYGLNILIYHGFGIYSLYGHCTNSYVQLHDEVKKGDEIATTGISGLALGDHLHFGILVQGIETRPEQWQDKKWLQTHIHQVLDNGSKYILGR